MEWLRVLLLSSTLLSVTDGDTVKLAGGQPVRLIGYDTPEIFSPKCEKEKQLGLQAKARLVAIVKGGVTLSIVSGSCAYGRECGVLTTKSGELVADILI